MKHRWILSLLSCALLFGVLHAEESAEQKVPTDQTAQIPKGSAMVARLPSLDRIDELAKRFKGVAELMGGPQAKALAEAGFTNFGIAQLGLDPTGFDRTTPVLVAMPDGKDEPYILLQPAKEKGITGEKELPSGAKLVVRDGLVHIGEAEVIAGERRGKPARLLQGDFALQFFVGELVQRHKEDIEGTFAEMKEGAGSLVAEAGIPAEITIEPMMGALRGLVYGIDTVDYAMTVKADVAETEGRIRTTADSALRKFLARAGAPMENSLADFLPEDAFISLDMAVTPDWPGLETMDLVKRSAGKEFGEAVGVMLAMSQPIWDSLSGRSAVSMSMQGVASFNMHALYELKEGTETAKLFEKFDITKINEGIKKLPEPFSSVTYRLEKDVAKHGETAIHRMSMLSDNPDVAMMMSNSTYYMAAEGRHMFMVLSPNGELEIKDLIDRVRKGDAKPGLHTRAMDRLGRKRNMGLTFNFGALKGVLALFAMMDPSGQSAPYVNAMPDELLMSTALSIHDGDIHWKGDFPLAKVLKMVDDIKAMQAGNDGGPQGEGDTEFD